VPSDAPGEKTMDMNATARDIEDILFQRLELDVWERALYWHLLRHTHVEGRPMFVTGLEALSRKTAASTTKLREAIRSMAAKGCITIDDRNRAGHAITVLLPEQIPGLLVVTQTAPIEIEQLDFYQDRRYLEALMERQQGQCVYCLRMLTAESAVLDHLVSQMAGGSNSHKNIVVACHACNSGKQASSADEFLRLLYRQGVLGQDDLKARLELVSKISGGALVPVICPILGGSHD